ncbi:hypothetical protein PVAP13_6KG071805 [Panicum virgatum]|uniref:Uncharacterized protein n=1 Tax=Panicum virgatum TaxID=38727 RepID=A0A8T0R8U4_PANVG|nr:hypothetical protein PVAP13_6KG071805 [Panicum virgatum]
MILKHASIGNPLPWRFVKQASIDFQPSFLTAMAHMESIRLQEGILSTTWASNLPL